MKFFPKCTALSNFAASFEIDVYYSETNILYGTAYVVVNKLGTYAITLKSMSDPSPTIEKQLIDACKPIYDIIFPKDTE